MLSLCMIVKNEENVLGRCLASARDAVDEIIIVDTGSTDRTIEIALSFGAAVISHDFTDLDFGRARNVALDAATGDVALVLDADEELRPSSAALLRQLPVGPGFIATRYNINPDGETLDRVDHAVRLFPLRDDVRYGDRVHETIDASILAAGKRLIRSAIEIDHHLPAPTRQEEKGRLYLSLLERDLATNPDDVDRLTFLAAEHHRLGDFAAATEVSERIADLRPEDHEAHLTVALYHLVYGGDLDHACARVNEALRLRPEDAGAHELLAVLQQTI